MTTIDTILIATNFPPTRPLPSSLFARAETWRRELRRGSAESSPLVLRFGRRRLDYMTRTSEAVKMGSTDGIGWTPPPPTCTTEFFNTSYSYPGEWLVVGEDPAFDPTPHPPYPPLLLLLQPSTKNRNNPPTPNYTYKTTDP